MTGQANGARSQALHAPDESKAESFWLCFLLSLHDHNFNPISNMIITSEMRAMFSLQHYAGATVNEE